MKRLDALAKADLGNSLVHYRRAFTLREMGRLDEALHEMLTAGRLGAVKFYAPNASKAVLDSIAMATLPGDVPFRDYLQFRKLVRVLADRADENLRQGRVDSARDNLEGGCRMGMNIAAAEPHTFMSVLVGKAAFAISAARLKPVYRHLAMKSDLGMLQRMEAVFERGEAAVRSELQLMARVERLNRLVAVPSALCSAGAMASCLMALIFLLWIPAAIARKCRQEAALTMPPWGEGWLVRVFLAIYTPAFLIAAAAAYLRPSWIFGGTASGAGYGLVVLTQLLVIGFVLRALHRRYDEHAGEHTGMFRFIFRTSAAAKAWARKYLIAAFSAQTVFCLSCFLLATIVYKPIAGGHPWETGRFRVGGFSREQEIVKQIVADLQKASATHAQVRNKDSGGSVNN